MPLLFPLASYLRNVISGQAKMQSPCISLSNLSQPSDLETILGEHPELLHAIT